MIFQSSINEYVFNELLTRVKNNVDVATNYGVSDFSESNIWIRIASGVANGLVLESNNYGDINAFENGENADEFIRRKYGTDKSSGTIGYDFSNNPIIADFEEDIAYRGVPVIEGIDVDDSSGDSGHARECKFSITCTSVSQLNTLKKYFFEPGNAVFLDWGMHLPGRKVTRPVLNVDNISKLYDFTEIVNAQEKSGGLYDSYLGFIKGGGVEINDSSFTLNVELVSMNQLAAFQRINSDKKKKEDEDEARQKILFSQDLFSGKTDAQKRFMKMFNELPSNFQTVEIKDLLNDPAIANIENFINFDIDVNEYVNSEVYGVWDSILMFVGAQREGDFKQGEGTGDVTIPGGYKAVTDNKYIRFGTLLDIINTTIVNVKVNGKANVTRIRKNILIGAFDKMFSTDGKKLFIPNKNTPWLNLAALSQAGKLVENSSQYTKTFDNTVGTKHFPQSIEYNDGTVTFEPRTWGYLDDLYVEFSSIVTILGMPNLNIRDSLYMILNSMTSAVNSFWDFQLMINPKDGILEIVDRNLFTKFKTTPKYFDFKLYGIESIVKDVSFEMSLSSSHMNRIVYSRRQTMVNSDQTEILGATILSATDDKILQRIQVLSERGKKSSKSSSSGGSGGKGGGLTDKEKDSNRKILMDTFMFAPKINQTTSGAVSIEGSTYLIAIHDKILYSSLKDKQHNVKLRTQKKFSPVLPLKLEMTTPGISGIKRSDIFTVTGLPVGYSIKYGHFIITSLKNRIDSTGWWTTIGALFQQITAVEESK